MLYFAGRGTSRRETFDDLWSGAGSRYLVRLSLIASELVFFFVFSLVSVEDGRGAGFAALKPVAKRGERPRGSRRRQPRDAGRESFPGKREGGKQT